MTVIIFLALSRKIEEGYIVFSLEMGHPLSGKVQGFWPSWQSLISSTIQQVLQRKSRWHSLL